MLKVNRDVFPSFDDMFGNVLDGSFFQEKGYPPYNLIEEKPYSYAIEIPSSGVSEDNLSITVKNGMLVITCEYGKRADKFLFQGMSYKTWTRQFKLAPDAEVVESTLVNGILKVRISRKAPLESEEKKIPINRGPQLLNG
jgi:HSP20 family molecular chaperone IbpA